MINLLMMMIKLLIILFVSHTRSSYWDLRANPGTLSSTLPMLQVENLQNTCMAQGRCASRAVAKCPSTAFFSMRWLMGLCQLKRWWSTCIRLYLLIAVNLIADCCQPAVGKEQFLPIVVRWLCLIPFIPYTSTLQSPCSATLPGFLNKFHLRK